MFSYLVSLLLQWLQFGRSGICCSVINDHQGSAVHRNELTVKIIRLKVKRFCKILI